ncbi:MAG: DUF1343 domain-containing protein [Chitinophagia bacterium]|nr:DUF1343 domain-containing protein [Chitinophagia bacterium]
MIFKYQNSFVTSQECNTKLYFRIQALTSQQILTATNRSVNMEWLIKAYNWYGQKPDFFNSFFDKLAGTKKLKQNIIEGKTAAELKQSWQKDIDKFMKIRKKYILYPDFK